MSNKDNKDKANSDVLKEKEKQIELVGTVTRPFSIQAKYEGKGENRKIIRKQVDYNVGDEFKTTNQNVFDGLIAKKRIKR